MDNLYDFIGMQPQKLIEIIDDNCKTIDEAMIYIDDWSYAQLYNLANIMKINKYNYDEWETLYDLKEYKKIRLLRIAIVQICCNKYKADFDEVINTNKLKHSNAESSILQ